jgi:hypothetical protein
MLAALDSLSIRFGSDMSTWRWQRVQNRRLHYPGASIPGNRIGDRFEPVAVEYGGHASTFTWGPPVLTLTPGRPGVTGPSAAWEGTFIPGERRAERRRPSIEWDHFLGAYLSSRRPLDALPLPGSADDDRAILTLIPAGGASGE